MKFVAGTKQARERFRIEIYNLKKCFYNSNCSASGKGRDWIS